ncbi:alpha-L RNA-binding motif-containing protein [Rhizopogon salebrosus TDB-379]|nr:alpha-L RNA-binding motif-containing protein [Rhizopogon salebrosus TDB-379]
MRDANVFAFRKAMPRMSWSPRNLYNLFRRSCGAEAQAINFTRTPKTLFQQRWLSKALVRAYHGDFINEKIFKRWYLPDTLPDVRPRQHPLSTNGDLDAFAGRTEQLERAKKRAYEEKMKGLAPVGSLMLAEVERRIDVFMFRCCFAHSVYEARRLVIHGSVLLNGKKHTDANTRLAPGDMISVDPAAIRFLQESKSSKAESDTDSKPESSDPSQSSPFTKTASQGSSLTPFNLPQYASPFIFIPAYAEVSFPTCSAIYVRHPTARPGYSEIPTPYDADGEVIRLAWEWYSKVRPRTRSKSQMAREPENRRIGGQ